MNAEEKTYKKILVVDSGKNRLGNVLSDIGFTDILRSNDPLFIEQARKYRPNLIVGDFYDKKQEQMIECLRDDYDLHNTPVILCTDKENIANMIRRINGNVNDYLVSPYKKEEVEARIQRVLERHDKLLNSNPLSHLPGNHLIKSHITNLSKNKQDYALVYIDLDNFKAYNDHYSYSKGDEVIQSTAALLSQHITRDNDFDRKISFTGHIGGDDFVFVRPKNKLRNFLESVVKDFDEQIKSYYSSEDLQNGFIITKDRKGNEKKFPLMSISLAAVINPGKNPMHYGELSLRGSEIKKYLKTQQGSGFLIDRRVKNK